MAPTSSLTCASHLPLFLPPHCHHFLQFFSPSITLHHYSRHCKPLLSMSDGFPLSLPCLTMKHATSSTSFPLLSHNLTTSPIQSSLSLQMLSSNDDDDDVHIHLNHLHPLLLPSLLTLFNLRPLSEEDEKEGQRAPSPPVGLPAPPDCNCFSGVGVCPPVFCTVRGSCPSWFQWSTEQGLFETQTPLSDSVQGGLP